MQSSFYLSTEKSDRIDLPLFLQKMLKILLIADSIHASDIFCYGPCVIINCPPGNFLSVIDPIEKVIDVVLITDLTVDIMVGAIMMAFITTDVISQYHLHSPSDWEYKISLIFPESIT